MKLKKWPEKDSEYWEAIEDLGGFLWRINHDLAHGRMSSTSGLEADLVSARKIQEQLVDELFENFGVVHPKDCPNRDVEGKIPIAPPGMIWYKDWYDEMKRNAYEIAYNKLICSACPLSEGLDKMISLGGVIPCGVFNGALYQLSQPYLCGMLGNESYEWTTDELFGQIYQKTGDDGLRLFLEKIAELKS